MKKTIEELRVNRFFKLDDREYVLTEPASIDSDRFGAYYSARAICTADEEKDEDGYQKCYLLRWEILESYDPEYDEKDCACNWDTPESIKEHGEYSLETGCYY